MWRVWQGQLLRAVQEVRVWRVWCGVVYCGTAALPSGKLICLAVWKA